MRILPLIALPFSLLPYAAAQDTAPQMSQLYRFTRSGDGYQPISIASFNGLLFGATKFGAAHNYGTIFELTPPSGSAGAWEETILYTFQGGDDGDNPYGDLARGKDGVLYGTTFYGGTPKCNTGSGGPQQSCGTVYSLTPPAAPGGDWTKTILYSFEAGNDGANPAAGVVIGDHGELYGTTEGQYTTVGTAFALTPPSEPGGAWTETVLHNFEGGSDGFGPGAVILGKKGSLFGTTGTGGIQGSGLCSLGCGTVFELSPPKSGKGAWKETVLYRFAPENDGKIPVTKLVMDNTGALYGTTAYGGKFGRGTVFQLTPPTKKSGSWTETILHNFKGNATDGNQPLAGMVVDAQGVLYGTTFRGGANHSGTLFRLRPPSVTGGGWHEDILYMFGGGSGSGDSPESDLAIDKAGALFGVTPVGGGDPHPHANNCDSGVGFPKSYGCGTVFRLQP